MLVFYIIIFILLIIFSAFFSSSETALLSLNKISLNLKARKKNQKAILLKRILQDPEEFFSTILIGNNFVNIAAASISTVLFTRLITADEEVILLVSTVITTVIVLFFAEIIPKSYAFRYSEKLSYLYVYPIRFFNFLFYPFVKITGFLSGLIFRKQGEPEAKKRITSEELKHFLASELYTYNPDTLRMLNEIIDIADKDIKSIMTPRMDIVALEESAGMDELEKLLREEKITRVPVFRESLDYIIGIVDLRHLAPLLLDKKLSELRLKEIMTEPLFISEFSSLHYVLDEMKKKSRRMAVIVDEYSSTLGILTLSSVFREILGDLEIGPAPVRKIGTGKFQILGQVPVEEVNSQLHIDLPEKKDYTTMSGLFIYHYGKFPGKGGSIMLGDVMLTVTRMGKRKIDTLMLSIEKE